VWDKDGQRILTASYDGTARVWDAGTGSELTILSGHTGRVECAAWSPDGQRIVTASGDGTARMWDAESGTELTKLAGHQAEVRHAAWDRTGQRVVTASFDGTARVFYVGFEDMLTFACEQADRNLSPAEWQQYMGDEPYRETCPGKPAPPD
jgi:WD40 repeat protein